PRRRVFLAARGGQGRHLRRSTRARGREWTCYHRNDTDPLKEAVRMKKYQLMAPGPTPVPSEVLLAMAQPMIHHRTPQYEALFIEVRGGLKRLFQTEADVLPLACSGTGAMEAAVVNTLSAGDRHDPDRGRGVESRDRRPPDGRLGRGPRRLRLAEGAHAAAGRRLLRARREGMGEGEDLDAAEVIPEPHRGAEGCRQERGAL